MKIIGIAVFLFVAVVGIAQEITPQRGVSFNATGILPAHDHSSPRNGAISGAAKLAIVNVGDQNTALTLDNTLDGTTRAPFIQFRKRTTAGTPAAVGAVLGQQTYDSSNSAGTSAEIRSTVRVIGSDAGGWPAGSDLDFRTAPGGAATSAQTRLLITELGHANFSAGLTVTSATVSGDLKTTGKVYVSTSASGNGNLRIRAGTGIDGGTPPITLYSWFGSSTTDNTAGEMIGAEYTIPANTMLNTGDTVEVWCIAKATTTSYSKQLVVSVDGDKDATGTSTSIARQWTNKSRIVRTTSTNLMHHAERERGDPSAGAGQSVDIDYTNTVSTSVDFKVQCLIKGDSTAPLTTAAGDEVMDLKYMSVVFYPAP